MLKFLLIVCIITYLIYKVGSFFFRAGAASQHFRNYQEAQRGAFDARKAQANPKSKQNGKFNGGEYVDFEEVKK